MSLIEILEKTDLSIFLTINGWNSPKLDTLMELISSKFVWIPAYVYLLFLLQKNIGWKNLGFAAVCIVILIVITDTGSVHLFKNTFQRYRPCHNENIKHLVHLVNNHCGGQYGFVSSHAANFFGIATLVWLMLHDFYKRIGVWLFLAAGMVGLSRIYLGVHYPSDVVVGALFGIFGGVLSFTLYRFLIYKFDKPQTS